MKTVYNFTNLDQELYAKDVLSPLVAQFQGLSHVTITSIVDAATKKTCMRNLQIIDECGKAAFSVDCSEYASIAGLTITVMTFLRNYAEVKNIPIYEEDI